ncbi:MAG TPA: efflux RND transporter periplasmic adaptor subunit [Candidatus Saccharimonadales bacterium]|nr:efflux RND transporter periplasmic adaptor subunit [Candidatus Saccharimonadales bacterium]
MKTTIITILACALFLMGCDKSGEERREVKPAQGSPAASAEPSTAHTLRIKPEMLRDIRVTTAPVEVRAGGEGAQLLGELKVNEGRYAEVGTPIACRVVTVLAAPGQVVRKGQQLAVLQSVDIGRARAESVTAQTRLDLAKKTFERKRSLAAENIVPAREVQEAEAGVATAEAGVRSARAGLRALGASDESSDSSELILRSPVDGTVIERNAIQGQMADPAQPLFRIGDLSLLWLVVHAFERDAVRLTPGSTARVSFAALPGRAFTGNVTLVGKQVDASSRTIPVRIEVANSEQLLRPGMSATAWVPVGKTSEKVIAVPVAALQRIENEWLVFLPAGQDTFEIRPVGRGRDLGTEIEIVSGLKAGERVVVEGAFLLKAEAEKARSEGSEHEH